MTNPEPTRVVRPAAGDPPPTVTGMEQDEEQRVRGARLLQLVRRSWAMWLVAFSLNGFFVYLGLLDLVGVEPRTPLTAAYYAVLCVALLAAAWTRRAHLVRRLQPATRLVVGFALAAGLLVAWYSLNTLLLSEGELAYRLAGLLLLWSVPTALAAATLELRDLRAVAQALALLALVYVGITAIALAQASDSNFRFSPIDELDYISAALVPALGAIASFFAWPRSHPAVRLPATTALVAAVVLPGSRGPVLAVLVAGVTLAVVWRHRVVSIIIPLALGLALGTLLSSQLGSLGYLSQPLRGSDGTEANEPISTLSIRRQWLETAVADTAERPLLGHGVGMLVDNTPEAHRMGVAGERIYPHNTFVEAAYSLGAVGLVTFLALVGTAAAALARVARVWRHEPLVAFLLGLAAFAFVNTNVSGAIGADAILWVVAAMAVALYADGRAPAAAR